MDTRSKDVATIIGEALEITSSAERESYLDNVCGGDATLRRHVDQLLADHAQAGDFLEKPAVQIATTVEMPRIAEGPGTIIGPYKLLEQIGEGGFGIVYMADQQVPVRRRVALKIIKPGMDTRQVLARFKAELQALSLMDHPNIARVLDAGATDSGRPYFVMELIRGVPITDYCDKNKLPVHERLDLFVQVCHAVQHAHQKGIIHRDIKPSNVLVTLNDGRPVPKVIDFGVAKALNQQLTPETLFTRFAEMIGTPLYMSPEQAEMTSLDIDTRSDVYSLGVLLYELLTGSTPFEKDRLRHAAYDEIRRIIREEEPPKPSLRISSLGDTRTAVGAHRQIDPQRLSQLVQGDLDWIVMKALEKDRTHRYDTASNFAADVLRYLSDQPVEARPPSAVYRFQKFARRNRAALTTAIVVLAAILLGTVVSATQAIRATRAERLAQTRLQSETEARNDAEAARQAEVAQRQTAENARQAEAAQRQVAEGQKSEAEKMRQTAETARADVTRQLYVSKMSLADKYWDINYGYGTRELLENTKPEHTGGVDLRGWEWHYLWRLLHSVRTLKFPLQMYAEVVAFSPDGQLLVAGGRNGTLKVWDAAGTHEVRTIKAHGGWIYFLAISGDGKLLATAASDGTVKLWETATWREVRSFPGQPDNGTALSADGHQLAIASREGTTIWDTSSGKEIRTLKGSGDWVGRLAFSPDGKHLGCSSVHVGVKMWDATTGRELWRFSGHKPPISALIAFSPDGKTLATSDDYGSLRCCDVETGRETKTFTRQKEGISCLAFNRSGTRIASGVGFDLKLWDPVSGAETQDLKCIFEPNVVAFSPHGDVIASGNTSDGIQLWDAASRQEPWSLRHPGSVTSVVYSGDGKRLAAAGGGILAVRDASTGLRLWEELNGDTTANLRFDPTSRILASGLDDGNVRLRDAQDGHMLRTLKAHDGRVTSLAFSPDGRVLVTGGADKRVALWNPLDGRPIATLSGHTDQIRAVVFSPNGKLLASAGNDRKLRLWDVSTGREVRTFVLTWVIYSMVFSRDGRQIFGGGTGGDSPGNAMIRVWDVEAGRAPRVLPGGGHVVPITGLALTPDDRRLAACDEIGALNVWDVATGQLLHMLYQGVRFRPMNCVDFSPDGMQLAVGTNNGEILVLDARPLTDELRAELNDINRVESLLADDRVESLFAEHPLSTDVIAALKADATISESVRNKAMERARNRHKDPQELNNRSWSIVSHPGLKADQYQLALRFAEAAVELAPGDGMILNTLGVAQYRVGKYAAAVETLSRSDQLNSKHLGGSDPADIAFLAMAHFQLGRADHAHKLLEQLRQLMQTDKWRANEGSQRFMDEAQQLISPAPVHAERPMKEGPRVLEPADENDSAGGRLATLQPRRAAETCRAETLPRKHSLKQTNTGR